MVAGPRTSHAGVLIRKGASGYCVTSEGSGGTPLRESTCSELASEWPSQAGGSFSLRVISGISNSQFTAHGPPSPQKPSGTSLPGASLLDYRSRQPGRAFHSLLVFPFLFFLNEDLFFFFFFPCDGAGKDTRTPPPTSRDEAAGPEARLARMRMRRAQLRGLPRASRASPQIGDHLSSLPRRVQGHWHRAPWRSAFLSPSAGDAHGTVCQKRA